MTFVRAAFTPRVIALVLAFLAMAGSAGAAPRSELWERWLANDPASTAAVDHRPWQALLDRYLVPSPDGINRFAYGQVSGDDRIALQAYIDGLAGVAVGRLNRRQQLAYWINLYNAVTVKVVLDNYPVASIRDIDISPGFFANGPWGRKLVEVEGEPLSLDDIEHRILRPIWRDPRIHYAVNCAALGCPNLAARAYTAENTEALLDAGARAYVNHPRGARVDDGRLKVSSLYVWYREDFGGSDAGVIAHLRRYAAPPLARKLAGIETIAGRGYDWKLNDGRRAPPN